MYDNLHLISSDTDRHQVDPIKIDISSRNVHPVFNTTFEGKEEERITSYPLTLHGGPVMAAPGKTTQEACFNISVCK